jgi:hypothetical protein
MNTDADFQMVCGNCGSLGIKIENPGQASREAIVYCGDCGASRGTIGALRDLAIRPAAHAELPMKQRVSKAKSTSEIVARHNELQSLRRKRRMDASPRK